MFTQGVRLLLRFRVAWLPSSLLRSYDAAGSFWSLLMHASLLDDISKGANWISSTFSGRNAARFRQDIPGFLARWLFRIGTIGAVVQVPFTLIVSLYTIVFLIGGLIYGKPFGFAKEMLMVPYLLASYAVWIGWGWRSRQPGNMKICLLFWLASAGFNAMHPIQFWMESESFWDFFHGLWSPFSPAMLWYIGLSILSLTALFFEFFRFNKHDNQAG